MARPMIESLEELEAAGAQLDLSRFVSLSSSAAVFSTTVKKRILERFPNLVLTDAIGATETGNRPVRARLLQALKPTAGRECYHPGRIAWNDGGFEVAPMGHRGSGDLVAWRRANAMIRLPPDQGAALGDFHIFDGVEHGWGWSLGAFCGRFGRCAIGGVGHGGDVFLQC